MAIQDKGSSSDARHRKSEASHLLEAHIMVENRATTYSGKPRVCDQLEDTNLL